MHDAWLTVLGAVEAPALRLVCLPHAGGSAAYFTWLRAALPADAELVCVQYPGRQERRHEPAVERADLMVEEIAAALEKRPDVPTVVFGHSLGSLLAFELVRKLEERGRPPLALVASGRRAPSVRPPAGEPQWNTERIIEEMRVLGGIDPALLDDPDIQELFLPALRADYRLAQSYRPEPGARVRCPLEVLTGRRDPRVTREDAAAWRDHTAGPFALHVLEGGHFFFDTDRATVLEVMRSVLDVRRPRAVR
ncbi:thioesterase II family protein [Streptomyces nanshensis]|uniref:Thioesterase domain-containing protein n=1 Tax=Streptomyces nanshensis TaxID=518642 RepID=A0A1E7L8A1_9ACTN|nr:alpha/beta fold hydrolase [Streptomyces nanshensis]OEV12437.1 hypothetical protein AN218_08305 [Streptomyces nanshensis]